MGCSACERRRKAALAKRKQFRDEKVARLTKGCDAGDENACRVLRSLLLSEEFRATNQFKPELHRRGQSDDES